MDTQDKKIVLILGGGGSIGGACADLLEKEGFVVIRHDIDGEYAADVTKAGELKSLIDRVMGEHGRVDVLVNSLSAPVKVVPIDKKIWADFENQLQVQLRAAVDSATYLVEHMKGQGGGKIINIITSYVAGDIPGSLSDYITAKYAMLGLTLATAKDLARHNIFVNAVSPSFIRNEFNVGAPEKLVEILIERSPSGRLTTSQDVARGVLFLINGSETGKNVVIDGGEVRN